MMIDDSIVAAAVEKDSLALQVLQNLATSQAMGYHIIWSSRRNFKQIIKITELSQNDRAIYYSILKSYATSASTYTSIDFYALVSVQEKSNRYNDHIVITRKRCKTLTLSAKQMFWRRTWMMAISLNILVTISFENPRFTVSVYVIMLIWVVVILLPLNIANMQRSL